MVKYGRGYDIEFSGHWKVFKLAFDFNIPFYLKYLIFIDFTQNWIECSAGTIKEEATGSCISCDGTVKKKPSDRPTKYVPGANCEFVNGKKNINAGIDLFFVN